MNRIQGQVQEHSQLAMSALAWISNAIRPLILAELKEALAVQPEDHALDEEAIPDEALIVSVSAGLITIDLESETIRLVHFTIEEYFRDLKHKWFPHAHSQIAETCLTYLSFDEFESGYCFLDEEYEARLEKNCLLEYAARNWGLHASRAENAIGDVALTFLLDKRKVPCASQILMKDVYPYRTVKEVQQQFTGLHLIAYFNVADLAKRFLEAEPVVNPKDSDGRTPLSWAAAEGHTAVVKVLLDRDDVMADSQDKYGQTPLSWAAENGHIAVVKLLLDPDNVVADSQDRYGQTPLSLAAVWGHETVVKLLLDWDDVAADSQDLRGRTPLSYAAEDGHIAVVKLLLDRDDIVADSQDEHGRTPLSWAAEAYYGEEAVKLLLDRDNVVADSKDEEGCTPLGHAIKRGRKETVKLLLDRDDVAADYLDDRGHSPLDYAVECGHNGIVKLLKKKLGDEVSAESSSESEASFLYSSDSFLDSE